MDSVKSDEARKPAEQDCSPDGVFPAPYYLLGSIPALLNLLFVESHPWVPVFFIFGFIPLLEFLVGPRRHNAIPAEKRRRRRRSLNEVPLFRIVLLMHAALSLASLMRTILYIHGKPSSLTVLRVFSTIPVVINSLVAGHEACHKLGSHAALDRFVGSLLISAAMNPAYRGDHPHHHRFVGLEEDAVCAPMGMSPYVYAVKLEVAAWKHSVQESRLRYARTGRLGSDNFVNCVLMSVGILLLEAACLSFHAVRAHIVIGVCSTLGFNAIAMLQEHAGLSRKPTEAVTPALSWDCSNPISNLFIFEAGRHSDHHLAATAPFPDLDLLEEAPELPYGMITMGLLAGTCPPLFWRLVRDAKQQHKVRMEWKKAKIEK